MVPLDIGDLLWNDLKPLRTGGTDTRIAVLSLFVRLLGSEDGRPPSYEDDARTVWVVDGDGQPPPTVDYFDWGGEHAGVEPMRIWYLRQAGRDPRGIGAFDATMAPPFREEAGVRERVGRLLGAPGIWLIAA